MIQLNRRSFLKGLVGTAAGILVAPEVLAEPERRVWALDRTYLETDPIPDWITKLDPYDTPLVDYNYFQRFELGTVLRSGEEIMWIGPRNILHRAQAGSRMEKDIFAQDVVAIGHTLPFDQGGKPMSAAHLVGIR